MRKKPKFKTMHVQLIRFSLALSLALVISAMPTALKAEPALWRVDGGEGTLYLFGTIHVLPEETSWLSPKLADIFDRSDRVVFEVVSSQSDEDALSFLAQTTNVFSSSTALERRLGKDLFNKYRDRMETFGFDEVQYNRYQPWYAAAVLGQLSNEEAGYFSWFGVDSVLQSRAEEADKKLVSLETSSQQVMFFTTFSYDTQIRSLDQVLERTKTNGLRMKDQLTAWITGDIATTERLVLGPLLDNPERYQVLIKNRNQNWLDPLEDLLNLEGVHFVAVGTGHIVGPDGLIKLLEEKGYSVIRE